MKNNISFDAELKRIEKLNKNWLPWIGEEYFNLPADQRLIVVGESCYETEDVDVNQLDYNRKITEKQGMQEGNMWDEDPNKFISTMHKNLEKSLSIDPNNVDAKRHFWKRVCYFNIIQRPLDSRLNSDRPHFQDFLDGWEVFHELVDILNPAYCIFNGVEASKHFNSDISGKYNYSEKIEFCSPKINRAYPRKVFLENGKKQKIKTIFMRHSSSYFSPELWKEFVNKEFEGLLPFQYS